MKRVYINEAVVGVKREIVFLEFLYHAKQFLKDLLTKPLTCDVSDFFKDLGFTKTSLIQTLLDRGIIEKDTKIDTIKEDKDVFTVSYKIPKRNFDRKMRRLYSTLFEKNEINESVLNENGGQLLAPNGKPSNLPAHLWQLVRSAGFKQWFGDWEHNPQQSSKVVDENGEPMVMLHNTKTDFDTFDPKKSIAPNGAMWFANQKAMPMISGFSGTGRGNIDMELFLNIRKPNYEGLDASYYAKEEGFDGVIIQDSGAMVCVVYEPNQIKSIRNKGNFANNNMNIYENMISEEDAPALGGNGATGCDNLQGDSGSDGYYVSNIEKTPVQRRKIHINERQLTTLLEMGTADAGNYQYDVPFEFNGGEDPAYDHKNIIRKSLPRKNKRKVKK